MVKITWICVWEFKVGLCDIWWAPYEGIGLEAFKMIAFHMVMWGESRLDSYIMKKVNALGGDVPLGLERSVCSSIVMWCEHKRMSCSTLKRLGGVISFCVYIFGEVLSHIIFKWQRLFYLRIYIGRCILTYRYVKWNMISH